jgi:hypothetical protein
MEFLMTPRPDHNSPCYGQAKPARFPPSGKILSFALICVPNK